MNEVTFGWQAKSIVQFLSLFVKGYLSFEQHNYIKKKKSCQLFCRREKRFLLFFLFVIFITNSFYNNLFKMHTEFLLALLYFLTILLVNSFLFQLTKTSYQKILFFMRMKKFFLISKQKNASLFSFLLKKKRQPKNSFQLMKKIDFPRKDFLLLGKFSHFLHAEKKTNNFYLELIAQQYMSL